MKEVFFDLLHLLIGLFIVFFIVWALIKTHLYFSKNNVPMEEQMKNYTDKSN